MPLFPFISSPHPQNAPPPSVFSVQEKTKDKDKRFRPLYDIPYMFEAREFLRKKLIGKKVRRSDRTLNHSFPYVFICPFVNHLYCPLLKRIEQ